MNEYGTRGERREEKRRKRLKMRIVGRGVRVLQDIIRRRADKHSKKEKYLGWHRQPAPPIRESAGL